MKLIKKKDIFQNINTEYDISAQVQRKLLNGNAQFIIDLAINLELNSYSTVSLAIHLCNYFFHYKCYLQYDRFIVAAASLLLAQKIKDGDPRMRKLLISFHKIMQSIEQTRMANEALMQSLQNKLCIAESRILKVIEYEFDIKLPNDYIEVICKKCVPKKFEEATFHTLKILILDSYRTYAPLVFHSWVILVGTFLVASSQFSYTPYMSPPPQLNMPQTTNEEEAYKVWLEYVESELRDFEINKLNNTNTKQPEKTTILKQEDLKDFLLAFNEMLFLNQGPESQQQQLQSQQTLQQS
ncbi:unnamed protein product (macronuclear) [Paramecium tetraurelia]|uniref:Uncharacterized protein n=1 Tax=Paramecium tetraurelia TaxID=5888 RepID=A0D7Q1_PARTE|nr:uncharacterized protein GSPATT00014035001 [Paramecium tetraurelia]CAK79068.1 unnamed protein product [Paramecium tetraurelia]|eukprot:XP_001446465.1 hypothetical protein (macronuclear) [Paramecium tetraurelia strain d4-2]